MIFPKNMRRVRNGPGGHESAMVCLWTASSRNPGSPFGGYSKGPSIDQIIAKKLPQSTAFPSLEFGVQHDGPGANSRLLTIMSYTGSDQPLAPESSPYKMLDRLMLGSASAPTGIRPEDLLKIRMRKQSALDLVKQELTALNTRIDRTDRAKLEQHLEGLTAIEKRLNRPIDAPTGPVSMGCGAPSNVKMGIDLKANASYPELLALQNSLAVVGAGLQPHPRGQPAVVPVVQHGPAHLGGREHRPPHAVAQHRGQRPGPEGGHRALEHAAHGGVPEADGQRPRGQRDPAGQHHDHLRQRADRRRRPQRLAADLLRRRQARAAS